MVSSDKFFTSLPIYCELLHFIVVFCCVCVSAHYCYCRRCCHRHRCDITLYIRKKGFTKKTIECPVDLGNENTFVHQMLNLKLNFQEQGGYGHPEKMEIQKQQKSITATNNNNTVALHRMGGHLRQTGTTTKKKRNVLHKLNTFEMSICSIILSLPPIRCSCFYCVYRM